LARLLLRPSNFLLLDEPTNHLDMRAKDVLLEALEKFIGTVVFVSHDRYFIDKLATRVFEIGDGEVRVFPGNYEDYLWRKEGAQIDLSLPRNGAAPLPGEAAALAPPEPAQSRKRLNPMKLEKLRTRAGDLESAISRLEAEVARLESSLAEFHGAEESVRTAGVLEQRRTELAAATREWEEISETIEAHS